MSTVYESRPAPGATNEDYVTAGPGWAVVLDGATAPPGVESGCVHDVAWLVSRLAAALTPRMITDPAPLPDLLAAAIKEVRDAHSGTCDVGNPDSPSSTVALARYTDDTVECLVLADSPVLVRRRDGSIEVIEDDRIDHLAGGKPYTFQLVREQRNRPGGFWVASTDPAAAYQAVTATVTDAREVVLLTDGVTRLVEDYGRTWPDLFGTLASGGPSALIDEVRAAEVARPLELGKIHDDATALWTRLG